MDELQDSSVFGFTSESAKLDHHPATGWFELTIPDEVFAAANWSA